MTDEARTIWRSLISEPLDVDSFVPLSSTIGMQIAAASVCGSASAINTDHYLAIRTSRLQETITTSLAAADLPPRFQEDAYALLVADGLGERGAGARASRLVLGTLARLSIRYGRWSMRVGPETPSVVAAQGDFFYRQLNDVLRRASRMAQPLAGMATSLTALYVAEGQLFFAHLGNSKAFLFRRGLLVQLTTDHVGEPVPELGPRRVTPAVSNGAQPVTRAIDGRAARLRVDVEHVSLISGDRLLLCTNGLSDVVSAGDIADTLALRRRPDDDCARLIELARVAGHPDDVTVLVADYTQRGETDVASGQVKP